MLIKKIITAGILFVILATSVVPVGVGAQQKPEFDARGNCIKNCENTTNLISSPGNGGNVATTTGVFESAKNAISGAAEAAMYNFVTEKIAGFIGWTLQRISGLVLLISGLLFDRVVDETVVKMSDHLGSKSGIGMSVNSAWVTLRDIANMVFIFVLLYTAFNAMFSSGVGNVGRNIAWIIVIALVINFSLFFSKVVIDASNVVSLGFYRSLVNANTYDLKLENNTPTANTVSTSTSFGFSGISGGYMRMLGIHSFWSSETNTENIHGGQNVLLMGILTAVFVLIAAVILFITSIMFVSRFVILIFIMILSPVAFVMFIIPGMNGRFREWLNALINQSFFAPVFFALTWVVFKVGSATTILTNSTNENINWTQIVSAPSAMMGLVINYFIIIGFSIFALTTAKKMASSVGQFTAVSSFLGGAVAGGTSWVMRSGLGYAGKRFSESSRLQGATKSDSRLIRTGARLGLSISEKARDSSFDIRSAKIPTNVIGEAIQGTVGRTGWGKKLGLNDVNIPSVSVGKMLKSDDVVGTGGTKGYAETKSDSEKRVRERETKETAAYNLAMNKKDIIDGADAPVPALGVIDPLVEKMEKALAKLSDKEVEALVASNRDLLKSQNFANAISVKQLEALNKSEQISDSQKVELKKARFSIINDAMKAGGAGAGSVKDKIKALADSELEMIDPSYLENDAFVKELRVPQFDSIIKSNKFTSGQKDKTKKARMAPIVNAIRSRTPADIKSEFRKADIKTKVIYLKTEPWPGAPTNIGLDPEVLDTYNIKTLQRMAAHDDMTDDNIRTLRRALLAALPPTNPVVVWLNTPDKGMVEFPD